MDNTNVPEQKVDLNEVLKQIDDASAQQFKEATGPAYCSVPLKKLRGWYLQVESAIQAANDSAEASKQFQSTKDELAALMKAAEAKDLRLTELTALAGAAQKARDSFAKTQGLAIKTLKSKLDIAKMELDETEAARRDTADALQKAKAQLGTPDSKFDPEAAKKIQREVVGLEKDLELSHVARGRHKAELSKLNSDLDTAFKELAAKDKALREAKAAESKFHKQLAAARIGNADLFDVDALDYERLDIAFGSKGVEKIKSILEVETWDVRGRVQKLTGFFTIAAKNLSGKYSAFVKLLNHALDVLKTGTSVWVAVLAPWVNGLLKDIVLFELKPVGWYRDDLKAKIEAVKSASAKATFKEKVKTSSQTRSGKSWREVARERAARTRSLISSLRARAAKGAQRAWAATKKAVRAARWFTVKVILFTVAMFVPNGAQKKGPNGPNDDTTDTIWEDGGGEAIAMDDKEANERSPLMSGAKG